MVETVFMPCRARADVDKVVESVRTIDCNSIGLVTTAQFVHQLDEIKKRLEDAGKRAMISPGRPNPGQVLGCDARAAHGAECYAYIGTGRFHALRVARETKKPVYMVRLEGGIEKVDEKELMKYEKMRAARIQAFKDARTVGLLVSTKPGQERMKQALELKKRSGGEKQTFIFVANEIKPDYFTGFDVDAWVNTACPRIAEDRFDRPVVDISDIQNG
jgi:2-(3-amino-3-carboxypropyl)histidine synthase